MSLSSCSTVSLLANPAEMLREHKRQQRAKELVQAKLESAVIERSLDEVELALRKDLSGYWKIDRTEPAQAEFSKILSSAEFQYGKDIYYPVVNDSFDELYIAFNPDLSDSHRRYHSIKIEDSDRFLFVSGRYIYSGKSLGPEKSQVHVYEFYSVVLDDERVLNYSNMHLYKGDHIRIDLKASLSTKQASTQRELEVLSIFHPDKAKEIEMAARTEAGVKL